MKLIIGNFTINTVSDGASVNVGTTLNLIDLGRIKQEQIPPERQEGIQPPLSPGIIGPETRSYANISSDMLIPHLPPL
ncbi:hypothetical protein [Risungbinella massiliensis]|uniref:hypothetical protein n=1 Tax=Risungbinella massiliensis TaxID=1329796 RepID=UPI0005CBE4D5|nr:hypothetical protein [Risungbinella massiliensis]